jgi:hypothetical protein
MFLSVLLLLTVNLFSQVKWLDEVGNEWMIIHNYEWIAGYGGYNQIQLHEPSRPTVEITSRRKVNDGVYRFRNEGDFTVYECKNPVVIEYFKVIGKTRYVTDNTYKIIPTHKPVELDIPFDDWNACYIYTGNKRLNSNVLEFYTGFDITGDKLVFYYVSILTMNATPLDGDWEVVKPKTFDVKVSYDGKTVKDVKITGTVQYYYLLRVSAQDANYILSDKYGTYGENFSVDGSNREYVTKYFHEYTGDKSMLTGIYKVDGITYADIPVRYFGYGYERYQLSMIVK